MSFELKQTCVRRLNELSDAIRREALDYVVQEAKRSGQATSVNALQYYNLVTQTAQKLLATANNDLQEIFGRQATRIDAGSPSSIKQLLEEEQREEEQEDSNRGKK